MQPRALQPGLRTSAMRIRIDPDLRALLPIVLIVTVGFLAGLALLAVFVLTGL